MQQDDPRRLTSIKRMGIVSLLGDTFHGTHIGFTVFENTYFEAGVAQWRIDEPVQSLCWESGPSRS